MKREREKGREERAEGMREDTKFSSARLNQQHSSSLVVITSHTFLLNDINACMHKVLKLKVSLILGICCPQVKWKILQGEGEQKCKWMTDLESTQYM